MLHTFMLNTLHLYKWNYKEICESLNVPESKIQIQSKWHPIYFLMHVHGVVAEDSSVHVVHQCMSCLCDFES